MERIGVASEQVRFERDFVAEPIENPHGARLPRYTKPPRFLLFPAPHKTAASGLTGARRVFYARERSVRRNVTARFSHRRPAQKGMVGLSRYYRIARRSAPMWRVSPAACAKEVQQGFSPFIQNRRAFFCFPLHTKPAALSFVSRSAQNRRVRFDRCAAGLLCTRTERVKEYNGTFFSPAACAKGHGGSFSILQNRVKKCADAAGLTGGLCKRGAAGLFPIYTKASHLLLFPAPRKSATLSFVFPSTQNPPRFLLFPSPHKSAASGLAGARRNFYPYYRIVRRNAPGRRISPAACAKGHGGSFSILQNRVKKCADAAGLTGGLCKRGAAGLFPIYTKASHLLLFPAPRKSATLSFVFLSTQKRRTFFCSPLHTKAPRPV